MSTGGLGAPVAMAIGGASSGAIISGYDAIVLVKVAGNWLVRLLKEQEQVQSQVLLAAN